MGNTILSEAFVFLVANCDKIGVLFGKDMLFTHYLEKIGES